MNFVQPIRDPEQIQHIKEYLKEKNERDYILFVMGINTHIHQLKDLDYS
ncbi:hypothetical protein QUF93_19035 [Bacillus hominis]|nr:hypothetical protein [Bacillus hominis]MDM5194597.1 hypothetical protein [Bacillus hominis]